MRLFIRYPFDFGNEDFVFDLMNKLDDYLRSCDLELLTNTVEVFVLISQKMLSVKEDIAERLKLSLFSSFNDG